MFDVLPGGVDDDCADGDVEEVEAVGDFAEKLEGGG